MRLTGDRNGPLTPEVASTLELDPTPTIRDAGLERLTGSFRVCLDATGHVESVLPMRSTGFADYDRKLLGGMQQWVYSPYLVDGVAVPMCTAVSFIYVTRDHPVRVIRR
ncbi:MAG: hypothetical protein H0T79_06615 [Deltaproteobacteria bacterium]|nr:hypothetical protein [Deltaproteobacteria bacterium]